MKLSELKVNQCAIIFLLKNPNIKSRIRLMEMGVVPGTIITKSKVAPFGDPIGIVLRGYEICISKDEASYILVEVIKKNESRSSRKSKLWQKHFV